MFTMREKKKSPEGRAVFPDSAVSISFFRFGGTIEEANFLQVFDASLSS